jgi:hypothetical protein
VAIKPSNASPVGRYPDHPHSGANANSDGTKYLGTVRKPRIPIRIVRIETIPMTDEEFDNAVEALAVLLNRFLLEHPDLAA